MSRRSTKARRSARRREEAIFRAQFDFESYWTDFKDAAEAGEAAATRSYWAQGFLESLTWNLGMSPWLN